MIETSIVIVDYYSHYTINAKLNGLGEFWFKDGRHYVGEWKHDKKNGKGRFTWPNGEVYQGMFKDDMRHGQGGYLLL